MTIWPAFCVGVIILSSAAVCAWQEALGHAIPPSAAFEPLPDDAEEPLPADDDPLLPVDAPASAPMLPLLAPEERVDPADELLPLPGFATVPDDEPAPPLPVEDAPEEEPITPPGDDWLEHPANATARTSQAPVERTEVCVCRGMVFMGLALADGTNNWKAWRVRPDSLSNTVFTRWWRRRECR
jgi:hypothetical protein